jgi:hypothetical protein
LYKIEVAEAANFLLPERHDFWHDRAAFHFLIEEESIDNNVETVQKHLNKNNNLGIGTFSENGPKRCSGLDIRQYSETSLNSKF